MVFLKLLFYHPYTIRVEILTNSWTSLAWPDRFFPFFFVMAEPRHKEKRKKRSGHARL